jgi:tetratricopeptide (TPR) repeat protein
MLVEAHSLLEESPVSLKDNILATKLKFKLSLALGREQICTRILKRLETEQLHDAETKSIAATLTQGTFAQASTKYRHSLGVDSVPDYFPEAEEIETKDLPFDTSYLEVKKTTKVPSSKSFHVLPLKEILKGGSASSIASSGIELDTTTLGELYFKQGYYRKAVEVYERLIKASPKNETLRAKLLEAKHKIKEQREERFSMSADIADQIETHEIIDIQRDFYQDLLHKVERMETR